MLKESTIRAELKKLQRHLKRDDLSISIEREIYGGLQALSWVLDLNAMAVSKFASPREG